ncbi:MAG: thioredoxin family protein [Bacilli bacterium]|nr:thioredoxin family protein [Bacilli bacterium]
MKKIILSIAILFVTLAFPLSALAEETKVEPRTKDEVNVYLFWGNGCGYCEAAKEFFASIEDEYGDKFELVEYEVWYDKNNNELKETVIDYMNDDASGVPYIVIGEKTFGGYASDFNEDIIKAIEEEYESDERFDVIEKIESGDIEPSKNYDTLIVIGIFVVVIGGFGALIFFSRKQ